MLGDARLVEIGQAISDGTPIDWDGLAKDQTDAEREILRELRLVAEIVDLHRRTHTSQADDAKPEAPAARPGLGAKAVSAAVTSEWEEQWGHLRLLEKLGFGAFGDVYRAWDSRLDREVALKLIRQRQSGSGPSPTSVIEEGRLLARVRHPNVVTVFGAERVGDRVGVWMELIQGRTLEDLIRERGVFGAREAMLIGIDLCRALSAVHRAGLLHRDVKSQNVMREDGGRIVLMDFGTGRERIQPDGALVRDFAGTPLYLAPEVLRGQSASAPSDIYSLGVLLFRIVSDGFPVRAKTLHDVRAAHERGDRVPLTDLRPDLPDVLVQVIERAIAFDPTQRYQSAGAMEQALSAALALVPAERPLTQQEPPPTRHWMTTAALTLATAAIGIALLMGIGVLKPQWWFGGSALRRIAVLPFENRSGDSNQHVVDGITDLLNVNLAGIGSFEVIASTSSRTYRGSNKTAPQIARDLRVDYVVEGSMLRNGDDVVLAVSLVDPAGQVQLSRSWQRTILNVLAFQGEIAQAIAERIAVTLTPEEQQRLAPPVLPTSAEAQDAYLRGRFALTGPTTDRVEAAVQWLEEAVRLDPSYALAQADLADAYIRLANTSTLLPRGESVGRAKAAALKAISLQRGLANPHVALARAQFYFDWDWPTAGASFIRALELNPSHADAHEHYAYYLAAQARLDEAMAEARRARDIDPLSPRRNTSVAGILFYARRPAEAIPELQRALSLNSGFATAHFGLGRSYAALKDFTEAIAAIERSLEPGREVGRLAELARIYADAGRPTDARRVLDEILARTTTSSARVSPDTLAYVYVALGEYDRAFDLLQQAVADRSSGLLWLKVDPRVDAIRHDSRFAALVSRVGLRP